MQRDTAPLDPQTRGKRRSSISTRLTLAISLIILISGITMIGAIRWQMKNHARKEAQEKAMILLDRNLAIHTYFSHQLKPALFKSMAPFVSDHYFDPVWMSSTYAVREIDGYYKALEEHNYYYKECAINARSPQNEADPFEVSFIEKLNAQPKLTEEAIERMIDGKPFFVVLRRGESMEQGCLRCHSTPAAAPADMVARYGPDRSFDRFLGEVVSAISIRIPLEEAYRNVNRLTAHMSILFTVILIVVFGSAAFLNKRWVFDPLNVIRLKALDVDKHPDQLGEPMTLPSGLELYELTNTLNTLSFQLRKERDRLEERVEERTCELSRMNAQLKHESDERQRVISKLQKALNEIKTLKGILPICSHCNKIRDDHGDWSRIESYISERSEADFSHSICPECAKKHYPGMNIYHD